MLGYNHTIRNFNFDVELYYKRLNGVLEYALLFPIVPRDKDESFESSAPSLELFQGTGHSRGIDFLISYQSKNLKTQLAYSLSKTDQTIEQLNNGQPYASQDDRRHQVKLQSEYRLRNWSFYANYIFASGRPFLELSPSQFIQTSRRNVSFNDVMKRLNAYQRVDLGAAYGFSLGSVAKVKLGGSIFNLLNNNNEAYRQNVFAIIETDTSEVFGNSIELLSFTPSVYLKVSF